MKRKNSIVSSIIVIGLLLNGEQVVIAQSNSVFLDVPTSHWAYNSIQQLVGLGYIKGYEDGYFGINNNITRAQAATVLMRWLKDTGKLTDKEELVNPFTDISTNHWAYKDILLLVDAGYMNGKGNGKFEPDATLTRAEMAKILVSILGVTKLYESHFDDVPEGFWGSECIQAAFSQGLVRGVGNNKYNPSGVVTRAEFTQFIVNGIEWSTKGVSTTEEMLEDETVIMYPYKSDYIDTYNLFREDLVAPESEELWEKMMGNQFFKQVISREGQELIVAVNEKYQTEYQFKILNRSLQLADGSNNIGFVSLLDIPENLGADGYRLIFNSKREVEVELARQLLQLFDKGLFEAIQGDLNTALTDITNSTGEYSNNTSDIRLIRTDIPGYKQIYIEVFYKTKGIWIYVDPNGE